jgi:hypothetical protein
MRTDGTTHCGYTSSIVRDINCIAVFSNHLCTFFDEIGVCAMRSSNFCCYNKFSFFKQMFEMGVRQFPDLRVFLAREKGATLNCFCLAYSRILIISPSGWILANLSADSMLRFTMTSMSVSIYCSDWTSPLSCSQERADIPLLPYGRRIR